MCSFQIALIFWLSLTVGLEWGAEAAPPFRRNTSVKRALTDLLKAAEKTSVKDVPKFLREGNIGNRRFDRTRCYWVHHIKGLYLPPRMLHQLKIYVDTARDRITFMNSITRESVMSLVCGPDNVEKKRFYDLCEGNGYRLTEHLRDMELSVFLQVNKNRDIVLRLNKRSFIVSAIQKVVPLVLSSANENWLKLGEKAVIFLNREDEQLRFLEFTVMSENFLEGKGEFDTASPKPEDSSQQASRGVWRFLRCPRRLFSTLRRRKPATLDSYIFVCELCRDSAAVFNTVRNAVFYANLKPIKLS